LDDDDDQEEVRECDPETCPIRGRGCFGCHRGRI